MSVTGYVLIEVGPVAMQNLVAKIKAIEGVKEACGVTGPFDIIVRAEADDVAELGELVTTKIQTLKGVLRATTSVVVHTSIPAAVQ